MKSEKRLAMGVVSLWLLLCPAITVFAQAPAKEIIEKSNWQKAEGLVPDPLLRWVKNGDWILPVAQLSFDPAEWWPSFVLEARKTNVGKYVLNEDNVIVDARTGKLAKQILGIPFPEIDPEDPQAAAKIIYNKHYASFNAGNKRFTTKIAWLDRKSGLEREVEGFFIEAYLTGHPGAGKVKNPKDVERYSIITVKKPYDLAGTSVMLWRYLSNKEDMNYSYVPAIRRVRRMSPANRSDGFVGSDAAVDDMAGYDGKTPAFEWKLIRKQEVLANYASKDPVRMVPTKKGEWMMSRDVEPTRLGFEEPGSTVAPWCPISSVYTKRTAWVVEGKAKDPYYNYGIQYMWIDAETWFPLYKLIHDRSDEFWKFLMLSAVALESADHKIKVMLALDHFMVDARRDHASYVKMMNPEAELVIFAEQDLNDFSLSGFQKFCK